jgi:glutaminyl-tRNA synthetase
LDQIYDEKVKPHQYEFARLNLNYTVMSKRKLLQLVQENIVNGWDDPRMPTISGYVGEGIQQILFVNFVILVAKREILSIFHFWNFV